MKKIYLIKDQGKGLVENITTNDLFNIANSNSIKGPDSNKSISYSLRGEIKTDGYYEYYVGKGRYAIKPIYRSVIGMDSQDLVDNFWDISNLIPGFEKIIKSDFTTYIDGNEYRGNILSGSIMACYIEYKNTTEFKFKRWADDTLITTEDSEFEYFEKIQIIVEYTKTTDPEEVIYS